MDSNLTALDRAFDIAKTGKFATATELRTHLGKEGYQTNQVEEAALGRQLRDIIRKSREAADANRT